MKKENLPLTEIFLLVCNSVGCNVLLFSFNQEMLKTYFCQRPYTLIIWVWMNHLTETVVGWIQQLLGLTFAELSTFLLRLAKLLVKFDVNEDSFIGCAMTI